MSDKAVSLIFQRLTAEFLYPMLEARGYRRQRRDWYCMRKGDVQYRVAARLARKAHQDWAIVQIGAGVAFPMVWEVLRQCPIFGRTDMDTAAGCGGSIRNMLPGDLSPSWDYINADSDPELLGPELQGHFQEYVFPFLEYYRSLDYALEYWAESRSFERLARAVAPVLRGRKEEAFADLNLRIREAEEDYRESQRPGDGERVAELHQFRSFLSQIAVC